MVVGSCWLAAFAYHQSSKERFEQCLAELTAKGEFFKIEDLVPPSRVHPGENMAEAPVFAEMFARRKANPAWNLSDDPVWGRLRLDEVPDYERGVNIYGSGRVLFLKIALPFDVAEAAINVPAVLRYTELHLSTLNQIREAVAHPYAGISFGPGSVDPYEFSEPFGLIFVEGFSALQVGNIHRARLNIIAMLQFSRHLGSQSGADFALNGSFIQNKAVSLIREGLVTDSWSESDLTAFANELQIQWLEASFLRAIRVERALALELWKVLREDALELRAMKEPWITVISYIPDLHKGWCYDNAEFYCRVAQATMLEDDKGTRLTGSFHYPLPEIPTPVSAAGGFRNRIRSFSDGYRHGVALDSFETMIAVREAIARNQVYQDQAVIGVALALYRKKHGQYPATLGAVVTPSVPGLPLDPFTGLDYLYRTVGSNDYLLYSPGPDGLDNGGLIRKKLTAGDWVWRLHLPDDFDYDEYRGW